MEDLLHGGLSVSEEDVHPFTLQPARAKCSCRGVAGAHEVCCHLGIDVGQIGAVLYRHNKQVTGVYGLNVHEYGAPFIAVHETRRQLAAQNAAEDAIAHRD